MQLSHWVRAAAEFPDYPFARFNKRIDIVKYSDDDYRKLLAAPPEAPATDPDAKWTREMTDALMELCRRYDLRWAVIKDRFPIRAHLSVEDLKQRFYNVMSRIIRARANALPMGAQSAMLKTQFTDFVFNPEVENRRRRYAHVAFTKAKPERILQERLLLEELRLIDEKLEVLRGAAEGGTLASTVLAEAVTAPLVRSAERAAWPLSEVEVESVPQPAEDAAAPALAPPADYPGAAGWRPGQIAVWHVGTAKEGKPRGGVSAWAGKSTGLDAYEGVRLRSEQMAVMPDASATNSRLFSKVTMLLGELGVPSTSKMLSCASTLHALTLLRRQSAALMRLQQAVAARERAVTSLQLTRKTMAIVPLETNDPLRALEERRRAVREHATARAGASMEFGVQGVTKSATGGVTAAHVSSRKRMPEREDPPAKRMAR
jgi:hypothetical protein